MTRKVGHIWDGPKPELSSSPDTQLPRRPWPMPGRRPADLSQVQFPPGEDRLGLITTTLGTFEPVGGKDPNWCGL
jgi:hypothetical protein